MPSSDAIVEVGGSGISWSGFNVYGDKKSMGEVHRLMYQDSLVEYLRERTQEAERNMKELAAWKESALAADKETAKLADTLREKINQVDPAGKWWGEHYLKAAIGIAEEREDFREALFVAARQIINREDTLGEASRRAEQISKWIAEGRKRRGL